MKNKKTILFLAAILVVGLFTTGCGKEIEVKNGSKVAVSTKTQKYTATEYYNKIKEDNISTLIDLIDHDLLDKEYKTTDEETEEIDKQINQIKQYYGEDEDSFISIIKQYFGVDTEKQLRKKLSLEFKRKEAVEDYIEKHITDKEIKDYYNENITGDIKASHILVAVNVKSDAKDEDKAAASQKALKKAKKIIEKLDNGEDFKDMVKKYSDDKATVTNGGDLGYFNLADMPDTFSEAVKGLKTDEYTKEPVETESGYHIILKTGEKDKKKLKEVKSDIIEKIREEKLKNDSSLFYTTLEKIREDKKIKWNDDSLKKAYKNYMKELKENANSSQTS